MNTTITDAELLEIISDLSLYNFDFEAGEIFSSKTKQPLARHNPKDFAQRTSRDYVRIKHKQKRRNVSVSRLIWMASRGCIVPPNCDVHHLDGDPHNNRADNLCCIHRLDHEMIHKMFEKHVPF